MKKIVIDGPIDELMHDHVMAELENADDVLLNIFSGGGGVIYGFKIYEALLAHSHKVNVHIEFAASIASIIAMAGDHISMNEHTSLLMIHRPLTFNASGRSEDLRSTADTLDTMEDQLLAIYGQKTGQSSELLRGMLKKETFMSASEALELGFIDEAINAKTNRERMLQAAIQASTAVQYDLVAMVAKLDEQTQNISEPIEINSLKAAEESLREHGYSRKEATHFVSSLKTLLIAEHQNESQIKVLSDFASYLKR